MSGLEPDDLRELMALFRRDVPQRAARLELRLDEVEAAQTEPARRAAAAAAAHEAHGLQGAAGTVGLGELAELSERLAETLRTGAPVEKARTLLDGITASLATLERDEPGEPGQLTVLHVEDNPLNARLVERVLARRPDVRVVAATDGETAIHLARRRRPDLVLLDLNLPGMSGVEVLNRLREDPRTQDLVVAVVTAHEPARTSQRLHRLGVREVLPKPLDVARLLELVDELTAGRAAVGR